jgi:hypothetical protein
MTDKKDNHVFLWIAIIALSITVCILEVRINMDNHSAPSQPTVPPVTLTPEQKQIVSAVGQNLAIAGQLAVVGIGGVFVFSVITVLIFMFRGNKEEKKIASVSDNKTKGETE